MWCGWPVSGCWAAARACMHGRCSTPAVPPPQPAATRCARTRRGCSWLSKPSRPSWPWKPRPMAYIAYSGAGVSGRHSSATVWYVPRASAVPCAAALDCPVTKLSSVTYDSPLLRSGLRPLARGISRRKCLATRSVSPLLMKKLQVASMAPSSRADRYPITCCSSCGAREQGRRGGRGGGGGAAPAAAAVWRGGGQRPAGRSHSSGSRAANMALGCLGERGGGPSGQAVALTSQGRRPK